MNHIALRQIQRIYKKIYGRPEIFINPEMEHFDYKGQAASDLIRDTILRNEPCMICRMGNTEMTTVMTYLAILSKDKYFDKAVQFIRGETPSFWWDTKIISMMHVYSGFFPSTEENLVRFSKLIVQDAKEVDILGSWIRGEAVLFRDHKIKRIWLSDLEPYRHASPWSEVLANRRVLVVHPFEESIKKQYAKRHLLFSDTRVLPDFDLITLKAVQSVAGNSVPFADWFKALDWMCNEIKKIEFDIAIIGAGAYGFPLAAYVKRLGKKAIHLGGASQLLFGIRGNRWDNDPPISRFYNEHWIKPLPSETPRNSYAVEKACYW